MNLPIVRVSLSCNAVQTAATLFHILPHCPLIALQHREHFSALDSKTWEGRLGWQSSHHYYTARESWTQVYYPKSSSCEISFFSGVGISCLPHQSLTLRPAFYPGLSKLHQLSPLLWLWLDLDNREPGQELGREGRGFF